MGISLFVCMCVCMYMYMYICIYGSMKGGGACCLQRVQVSE